MKAVGDILAIFSKKLLTFTAFAHLEIRQFFTMSKLIGCHEI